MPPEDFRRLGHQFVDWLADFLAGLADRRVTPGETPEQLRAALNPGPLPERGVSADMALEEAWALLNHHSLFTGHPRFLGYITGSPAPIGALAELLAATLNPNSGAWILSPMATEIEAQTVRWIAEFIGYPADCGGLLVSGGNMANFIGFLAARRAQAGWDFRAEGGASPAARPLVSYVSQETHTWIQKAADLFGLGTNTIRWIPADAHQRMDLNALRRRVEADRSAGAQPFLVVGNAGTVSTGAIDPLREIAALCREYGLWFHVDGAYGAPAAAVPGAAAAFTGLAEADSVAVDPHKWLYVPLEAGCALVRHRRHLTETFDYTPAYYRFDVGGETPLNFYALGPQNSRGFRALKVWLAFRLAGREGMAETIADDIRLARELYERIEHQPELEALTHNLSITTFRYMPPDMGAEGGTNEDYRNKLNAALLDRLQKGGEVFLSNAMVGGKFGLRACVVNFRTSRADIAALPEIVTRLGRETDRDLRPAEVSLG